MAIETLKIFFTSPVLLIASLGFIICISFLIGYAIRLIIKLIKRKDIPTHRKRLWILVLLFGPFIMPLLLSFIGIETSIITWLMIILIIVYYDVHKNYKRAKN